MTSKKTRRARMYALFALIGAAAVVLVTYLDDSALYIAPPPPAPITLDYLAYNRKMVELANYGTTTEATGISATSTMWNATSTSISSPKNLWPVSTVYPKVGAILPFSRVVAYYGNFSSKAMGILGEIPSDQMIAKLKATIAEWEAADPSTPVIPALDYIAVTAQGSAGPDGKYRLRMPASQIEQALALARDMKGLVFLDVQPGLSDLATEVPLLEEYLKLPYVELAIDPEFSMKTGARPGTVIGTMSADDVNYAAGYLAGLVRRYDLPPKILVVHRFTEDMVTGYKKIEPLPEVQIVINMDGWSSPLRKEGTYGKVVHQEPVQFSGIKLFYKNDVRPPSPGLMTTADVFKLRPKPSFIEYQ